MRQVFACDCPFSMSSLVMLVCPTLDILHAILNATSIGIHTAMLVLECCTDHLLMTKHAHSLQVLFVLSWRLGPILALVIVATAGVVSTYRKQTKAVESAAGNALARMVAIADQAFRGITTVRCVNDAAPICPRRDFPGTDPKK